MADPEKLIVAGLIFFFLGGSFLAMVWVLDSSLLPVAALLYLLVGISLIRRVYQAEGLARHQQNE